MVPSLSVSNRITIKPIMAMSGGSFSARQQLSNSRFEVARLFLNLIRRYKLRGEISFFQVIQRQNLKLRLSSFDCRCHYLAYLTFRRSCSNTYASSVHHHVADVDYLLSDTWYPHLSRCFVSTSVTPHQLAADTWNGLRMAACHLFLSY